jgi:hypothetical protein
VADVFRRYRQQTASLSTAQRRVMTAIETCRTAALGVLNNATPVVTSGTR